MSTMHGSVYRTIPVLPEYVHYTLCNYREILHQTQFLTFTCPPVYYSTASANSLNRTGLSGSSDQCKCDHACPVSVIQSVLQ